MKNGIHHFEPRIAAIYDHLYANSSFKTPKTIAVEVQKILHTCIFIEQKAIPGSPAISFTATENKELLSGESKTASEFAKYFRSVFLKMVKETERYPAKTIMEISDFDLTYACKQLEDIWISDPSRDVFGDAVELFRSYWSKSHGGQFFTDPHVTSLAIKLLDFDPQDGDDLVDITAGTGGFLLAGVNYLEQKFVKAGKMDVKELQDLVEKSMIGQELDADVGEVGNAAISSRLGHNSAIIHKGNSLFVESEGKSPIRLGKHRCAATNPPFGTKITIKDPSILNQFEIAKAAGKGSRLKPCSPDVLFLERNLSILKPGGRLAIVLPFQILSGPQTLWVREWLLQNARIKAVIDLPSETFQPYTGTKASLVVLVKDGLGKAGVHKENIFMACPKWIGHDRRGNPMYKVSPDGKSTDNILTDFPEVEKAYEVFVAGKEPSSVSSAAFTITADQIASARELRIDAWFHHPHHVQASTLQTSRTSQARKTAKLKDLVSRIFFPGRFKRLYIDKTSSSVPFLGGTNISQLLIVTDKWLSPSNPHLNDLTVEKGWILVTRSGSTGIVALVPPAWENFAISEHVIRIVPDESKLSGAYLYAFLKTAHAQAVIRRGVFGSVIDEISPDHLGEMEVPLPRNKAELDSIVRPIKEGEAARQTAISKLENASNIFEERVILNH
ncbi:MAG: N-6 DNA methylase [Deltaproteobacteria bacterium]|nr:N-6 DNA methylase [Deltaproteobacteria bacterium]